MRFSRRNFMRCVGGMSIPAISLFPRAVWPQQNPGSKREPSTAALESWIEVDLASMGYNLRRLREMVKRPVLAVIKANAYGHGLLETAAFLDKAGIEGLMVCRLTEAVRLRESGVTCPIYKFGPLLKGSSETFLLNRITPILSGQGHDELERTARKLGMRIGVHAHIDTGMHRAGIMESEALTVLQNLARREGIELTGLSTTLTEDPEFDRTQLDSFLDLCRRAHGSGIDPGLRHAASSAAVFGHSDFFLDMVRPGIVLYGGYPNATTREEDRLKLRPVLSFKARVAEVKTLQPGDGVSYHRAYRASQKETIAVLPVGYSDGYPPQAAGKGHVLIGGLPCPIIASITANHMEVRLPGGLTSGAGDEAVLIGKQGQNSVSADDVAGWAETSIYRVLIGMNPRLPRILLSS
jgi:alanine racemase